MNPSAAAAAALSVAVILVILTGPSAGGFIPQPVACNDDDMAAMVRIRSELSVQKTYHWDPNMPCCGWTGVDCDASSGRVVGIHITGLFREAFSGEFPAGVAKLPFLKTLVFEDIPGITGPIPRALTKLKNLERLVVTGTGVSGEVPPFLRKLTGLKELNISSNALSGGIPPRLADLSNLTVVDLSNNSLSGKIPGNLFSNLSSAAAGNNVTLALSHNNLSGEIPDTFAGVSFVSVDLSHNRLKGEAFMLFVPETPVVQVDVSHNRLSFDLSAMTFPKSVSVVDMSHNEITGAVPAGVAELPELTTFDVSYNRLCGAIPNALAQFDRAAFAHNECLCGAPLPPCD